jgi:hypothetical protein
MEVGDLERDDGRRQKDDGKRQQFSLPLSCPGVLLMGRNPGACWNGHHTSFLHFTVGISG